MRKERGVVGTEWRKVRYGRKKGRKGTGGIIVGKKNRGRGAPRNLTAARRMYPGADSDFARPRMRSVLFGHKFPVAHGHIAFHLFFVRAGGDVYRAVVFFPQRSEVLLAVGKGDVHLVRRIGYDALFAVVQRGFAARYVVYH